MKSLISAVSLCLRVSLFLSLSFFISLFITKVKAAALKNIYESAKTDVNEEVEWVKDEITLVLNVASEYGESPRDPNST